MTIRAYRSSILHCVNHNQDYEYFADGLLLIVDGKVHACGPYADLSRELPADIIDHYPQCLITPGFIDTHIHYPQIDMIASFGEELLSWLEKYTFPTELQFADLNHCQQAARFFLEELLRNGTTTALVFASIHSSSADSLFAEAQRLNMRLITGKVLSDRNVPHGLQDTPASAYSESKALIEKWHGQGRLHYAVSPRFAPTSSEQQLSVVQQLIQEYDDIYLQTHLSENQAEIAWVKQLFPWANNYLEVYDRFKLLGKRSVFAHGVHLSDEEMQRLAATDTAIAFCPSSNLFLGSGLFPYQRAKQHQLKIALGTDIGAGTSFSLMQTYNEAYKICQCQHYSMNAFEGFYLATLGGARALDMDDKIGNFSMGKEADFIIHDLQATPLLTRRLQAAKNIEEILFALFMLGDDRMIKKVFVMGKLLQ